LLLDGVLWALCSGAARRDMPERFGRLVAGSGRTGAAANGQKRTLACYRCRPKAADGLSDNSFIAMLELLAEG
jgi:hypothetical protein